MGLALVTSRRGVNLVRLSLVSVVLLTILFSGHYYLPTVHDALPLDVFSEPPTSKPSSEEAELEDTRTPVKPTQGVSPKSSTCRSLPGGEDVTVSLKTGATELYNKLPEQLLILSECIPNLMLFSDLEQDIGDFHIHGALDDVSEEYRESEREFEFYRELKRAQTEFQDLSLLNSQHGWDLDKWKFLPILHKVYEEHPASKWFVFVEADTYLSWSNLLQLLDRLDPEKPLYFGSSYVYGDTTFAQGGTGYVMSNAALKMFEEKRKDSEYMEKWEKDTSTCCCGDVIVGEAMLDAGVKLTPAWPLVQSESPLTLEWSDRIWCTPAVTWHHVHPFEAEALWSFEQAWIEASRKSGKGQQTPYLYRDVFEYLIEPAISANRSDWNNMSRDRTLTKPAEDHRKENTNWDDLKDEEKESMWADLSDVDKESVESAEACFAACAADEECLQYFFRPGSCLLNKTVRLGSRVDTEKEEDKNTASGWMLGRIEEFKRKQPECVPAWDLAS